MFVSINGALVLSARITMPRVGAWHARLSVDGVAPPSDPLVLSIGDEAPLLFKGSTAAAGGYAGTSYVVMVGGAGGLGTVVDARQYLAVPAQVPLAQILSEAGEVGAAGIVATPTLGVWTRQNASASTVIAELADECGAAWRVLADGTIWFGPEAWPDAGITADQYVQTDLDPSKGYVEIAMESPALTPGALFLGRKVSLVQHDVSDGGSRTRAWFEAEG